MNDFLLDVRQALRGLNRRPGFALVAVATIALGIAAASAIWSVVDAVLVRPLPFSEPERLVFVWEHHLARQRDRNVVGPANLLSWRERARSFSGLAGFSRFDANLDGAVGEPERIPVGFTTGNLFTVLGTPPLLGRTLLESDSAPGAADVVVLGEGYWRRRFGADPAVVGHTLRLNGEPVTVVGVMPGTVQIPAGAALWVPFTIDERMRTAGGRYLTVVGRLREGVSVAQAADEMTRLAAQLAAENADLNTGWSVNVQPLHADLVRQVRPGLLLLLVATGLLLRSFWTLGSVALGFEPAGVLAASLSPGGAAYREAARIQGFYREALERLREQPGVTAVGAISWTPLGAGGAATSFTISGREAPPPGQAPVADVRVVTPGLFETLRIPVLHGRDFTDDDRTGRPPVAVINLALARELGPPGAALGQRVQLSWGDDPEVEIVGVVGDVHLATLDSPPRATVYLAHGQDPNNFMTLMLRTDGPEAALVPGLRATIASLDPALPIGSALPLDQVVSHSLRSRRFVLVLVALFGGAALALAGIGLFGVMAYLVAQRKGELGVRLVLGARPRDVVGLVVSDGMRLVGLGLALGVVGGLAASRALQSQLFGVRPWDPVALAGVAVVLSLVSLLALATPAWHAASIDPGRAMRVD